MLPGVTGSLVSGSYLVEKVLPELDARPARDARGGMLRLQRWWTRAEASLGPASSARAVLDTGALPLVGALGYRVVQLEPHAGGFIGALADETQPVALLCCGLWEADADRAWRGAVRAGRVAGVRWAFIYTGPRLRIVDAARTWARRWIEFDVATTLGDERSTAVLLGLTAAPALHPADHGSMLERVVDGSHAHARRVCTALGDGVIEALTGLVNAIETGAPRTWRTRFSRAETFDQALTLIYRLLFLLFAEARALVPTWHQVYRDAYTIGALDRRIARSGDARGVWSAIQAISRLAHAGCRAGDLVVTPFNGRLFSPRHTPAGERSSVADALAATAVRALTTHQSPEGRRPVSYADLGVEQLGAVYERVLDYEPQKPAGAAIPRPVVLTRTSTERKATGSFYTPRSMTEFLVRRTLLPLVENRSADDILTIRVVDPAMGSGAFLVAACRFLADAAGRALDRAGRDLTSPDEHRVRRSELRRLVAQRCLYGVDLNPMAVQLARLSLWLTTLAADRPLSFLDHHLAVGDSLVGATLADLARQRPGRRRASVPHTPALPLFDDAVAARMVADVLPSRFRLSLQAEDSVEAVHEKERALAALMRPGTPLARWRAAADFWCAGWFLENPPSPGVYEDVLAALLGHSSHLPCHQRDRVADVAAREAAARRFFHWELVFPEVFFGRDGRRDPAGGFDAVLGNPPWDALRADTGDAEARAERRPDRLARLRFLRESGVYGLQGQGHVNQYQLFLERALSILRPGGRLGLILPSGLATDQGSGVLRRALLDRTYIERLHGFDNRRAIFPVHRDTRFLLLTATAGGTTERLTCAFGLSDPRRLDRLPDRAADDPPEARPVVLSRAWLERRDPDHVSWPLVPAAIDLQILALAHASAPALGSTGGWGAVFGRELNATDDRRHFAAIGRPAARGDRHLPIVEGKHLEPFRARHNDTPLVISRRVAATLLDAERTFLRSRLAYRDVASATNRVTLIAARLPAGVVTTHTIFCLKTPLTMARQYCLLALLNSVVVNYLVRLQVTTHVTAGVMARVPVPRPDERTRTFRELASLARSLERTGPGAHDPRYVRLNTLAARLYGLTPDQYAHIVSTFPLLPDELRASCVRDYQESHREAQRQAPQSTKNAP
jgi:hypothetical protein